MDQKTLGSCLFVFSDASRVDAAFVNQKAHEVVHCRIVGPANQRCRLTFLGHKTRRDQPVEVMGQRRGRDSQFLLDVTNRQPLIACPNKGPVNP